MRYALFILIVLHGLIHLLGFVKAFKLAEVKQLLLPITPFQGTLWLTAFVFFGAAGVLLLLKNGAWWMPAAAGVLLSQMLVFQSWSDAKYGTLANVFILLALLPAFGAWRFQGLVKKEKQTLLAGENQTPKIITQNDLATLPPVVQRWLERSGAVGKPVPQFVHLKQSGEMKTKPDGKWIPFTAEQDFNVTNPGFLWTTEIEVAPGLTLGGRDLYLNGHGHMLIKAFYLFPVADATGPETDQGTMLRYLAEASWFPGAALSSYIRWDSIDDRSARAAMTYGGVTASGIFHFNAAGDFAAFDAKRYYTRKEGATLEDWHIEAKGWKTFGNGVRIAHQNEVSWKLAEGDFTWLKLEISELETN